MTEILLGMIAGMLGVIASLIVYIWMSSQKKIDGLIQSQQMFFQDMSEFKKGLAEVTILVRIHDDILSKMRDKE